MAGLNECASASAPTKLEPHIYHARPHLANDIMEHRQARCHRAILVASAGTGPYSARRTTKGIGGCLRLPAQSSAQVHRYRAQHRQPRGRRHRTCITPPSALRGRTARRSSEGALVQRQHNLVANPSSSPPGLFTSVRCIDLDVEKRTLWKQALQQRRLCQASAGIRAPLRSTSNTGDDRHHAVGHLFIDQIAFRVA